MFLPYAFKKKSLYFLAVTTTLTTFVGGICAFAQVSVNRSALDHLGPVKKNTLSKPVSHKKTIKKRNKTTDHESAHPSASPKKKTNSQTQTATPPIPNAPPPIPVFRSPDLNVPLHPPTPPAMPKIIPNAPGNVTVTNQHTLINFSGDSTDLNETMMKTIMEFANTLKQHPDTQVYLNAYSHGTADDISTPRRNALNRGLIIRAVLINQGIPPTRIYLLAKGIPTNNSLKNPDYVEMILSNSTSK